MRVSGHPWQPRKANLCAYLCIFLSLLVLSVLLKTKPQRLLAKTVLSLSLVSQHLTSITPFLNRGLRFHSWYLWALALKPSTFYIPQSLSDNNWQFPPSNRPHKHTQTHTHKHKHTHTHARAYADTGQVQRPSRVAGVEVPQEGALHQALGMYLPCRVRLVMLDWQVCVCVHVCMQVCGRCCSVFKTLV